MTRIREFFNNKDTPCLSFEFFPPKTESANQNLLGTLEELTSTNPDFVSVTYGAMGSTRDTTRDIVIDLCRTKPFPAMAHLTCVGHTREDLVRLLDEYAEGGVSNILALSGDLPQESSQNLSGDSTPGDFEGEFKYAIQLVELVKEHPHDFSVGVAAHPEVHPRSTDLESDRKYLAEKLELADFAVTQFFFYPKYYFQLVDEISALGIQKPIIAGVIPVINTKSVRRFSEMNKVDIDEDLFGRLDALFDSQASSNPALEFAIDSAYDLITELLKGGAPGVHIYTLNQSSAAGEIARRLRS